MNPLQHYIDMRAEEFKRKFRDILVDNTDRGGIFDMTKPIKRDLYFDGIETEKFIQSFHAETIAGVMARVRDGVNNKRKLRNSPRQLYKFDGKTEQIMYYENDGDLKYNEALDDILSLLPNLDTKI